MEIKTKLIIGVLGIGLLITGAVYISGEKGTFTGRLDKEVAFFKAAPEKEKVIESTFASYKDAADSLSVAAVQIGRITQQEADELKALYTSEAKISRAELTALAVQIFKLESGNYRGPHITDVNQRERSAESIYTCVAHGCIDIEFKPGNQATWDFVNKVGKNLQISVLNR